MKKINFRSLWEWLKKNTYNILITVFFLATALLPKPYDKILTLIYLLAWVIVIIFQGIRNWKREGMKVHPAKIVLRVFLSLILYSSLVVAAFEIIRFRDFLLIGFLAFLLLILSCTPADQLRKTPRYHFLLPVGIIVFLCSFMGVKFSPIIFALGLILLNIWMLCLNLHRLRASGKLKSLSGIIHIVTGVMPFLPLTVYMIIFRNAKRITAQSFPIMVMLTVVFIGIHFLSHMFHLFTNEDS